ncbi:unnamed protein product [Cunninghamella echinulata]
MSGEEVRDMLFGRLFGLMAIVSSGLFQRSSPYMTKDDMLRMLDLVADIANAKHYLLEVSYHVVINMLPTLLASDQKKLFLDKIVALFFTKQKVTNANELNLYLALLEQENHNDEAIQFLLKGWKHQFIFDPSNLEKLATLVSLSANAMTDDKQQITWTPQLHSVWDRLLNQVLPTTATTTTNEQQKSKNRNQCTFTEFWTIVVDQTLFDNMANHGRKYWGFQVFNKTLPRLSPEQLPLIFTENFMRTLMNNLSSEVRFLNKAAKQTTWMIQQVADKNKKVGFVLISQLIGGKHGHQQFDTMTKTKTVEHLLTSMDSNGIQQYLEYLAHTFILQDENNSEATIDNQREWTIQQMLLLITNPKTPKDEKWINDIIQFLLVYTFFDVSSKKGKNNNHYLTHYQQPKPALSDNTLTMLKNKLESLILALSKLAPTAKSETGHLKTKRWNGTTNDGQLWAQVIYQHWNSLLASKPGTLLYQPDDDDEDTKIIHSTQSILKKIKQQQQDVNDHDKSKLYGFEFLFSHILVKTLLDQEKKDSIGLLEDLLNCFEKMDMQIKLSSTKADKKKNKKKEVNGNNKGDDNTFNEPQPIEVIVDMLVSFLTSESSLLKGISTYVFEIFSSLLTKQAMENLIAIVTTSDSKEGGEELFGQDDENDEDEEEEGGDEDEDEDEDDEDDDDDVEMIDVDMDEDDEEVDEELRLKVEEALRSQGILADEDDEDNDIDSEEEELLDDDAMEAFDEKLAEIFKIKKSEKSQKKSMEESVVHFKNNVMEFIIIFAKKNPKSPLNLDVIVPLLQTIQSGVQPKTPTFQFVAKVKAFLKNKLSKSIEVPDYASFDDAAMLDILKSIHTYVMEYHHGSKEESEMCTQLLLYLRKCIIGTGADLLPSADNKNQTKLLEQYIALYDDSLQKYISKKSVDCQAFYFGTLIQRFPCMSWPFMNTLINYVQPEKCGNTYRHTLVCHWIGILIQHNFNKDINKKHQDQFIKKQWSTLVKESQQVIQHYVDQHSSNDNKKKKDISKTIKPLMKLVGTMDRTYTKLMKSKSSHWDKDLFTSLSTLDHMPIIRTTCKTILDRS